MNLATRWWVTFAMIVCILVSGIGWMPCFQKIICVYLLQVYAGLGWLEMKKYVVASGGQANTTYGYREKIATPI